MADDSQRPIVLKRVRKRARDHHGGAWKIAYADFVTAMMAFFLLMWLLGSTTKAQREGIADYFSTPLKVALEGGEGSGTTSSVLKGGGKDLTRREGQVKYGDIEAPHKIDFKQAEAELARREKQKLGDLKGKLEKLIETNPVLKQFQRQLLLDITSEGLRVQIVDEQNRPMFDSGGAKMKPYTQVILWEIGKLLNGVQNRISMSGHTDAVQYSGGERGYSNWELSADRANAARRELIQGGLEEGKVLRVVGLGSAVPFDKNDPAGAVNRRISIIVMNRKTEEAISREGEAVDARRASDLGAALGRESPGGDAV